MDETRGGGGEEGGGDGERSRASYEEGLKTVSPHLPLRLKNGLVELRKVAGGGKIHDEAAGGDGGESVLKRSEERVSGSLCHARPFHMQKELAWLGDEGVRTVTGKLGLM